MRQPRCGSTARARRDIHALLTRRDLMTDPAGEVFRERPLVRTDQRSPHAADLAPKISCPHAALTDQPALRIEDAPEIVEQVRSVNSERGLRHLK